MQGLPLNPPIQKSKSCKFMLQRKGRQNFYYVIVTSSAIDKKTSKLKENSKINSKFTKISNLNSKFTKISKINSKFIEILNSKINSKFSSFLSTVDERLCHKSFRVQEILNIESGSDSESNIPYKPIPIPSPCLGYPKHRFRFIV